MENDVGERNIDTASDKDADTCTMSVDRQPDDGKRVSERGDGDRHKECDRSNPQTLLDTSMMATTI